MTTERIPRDNTPVTDMEESREPLSIVVARELRTAILDGELVDGQTLPSEKALCVRFGVGRSSVREALRILQAQGLVSGGQKVSTRGPSVDGSRSMMTAAAALETVMLLGRVPLSDLVELRLVLEEAALASIDLEESEEALDRAREALEDMKAAIATTPYDRSSYLHADVSFHLALLDASSNRAYALVMTGIREAITHHLEGALERMPRPKARLQRLVDEHEAILKAVSSGHGKKAGRLVREHIIGFYAEHLDA